MPMLNTMPPNPFPPSSESAGNGGGGQYVLPIASADTLGGVMVDGAGLDVNESGVLTVNNGEYLETDNNGKLYVKRDISYTTDAIIEVSFAYPICTVTKSIDNVIVDTQTFNMNGETPARVFDVYSVSFNAQAIAYTLTNLKDSKEHAAGYSFTVASYSSGVVDTQTFTETVDFGKKLMTYDDVVEYVNSIINN